MSKVTMVGKITCADGQNEAFEAALGEMTAASRAEPGCEIYSYHRGDGNVYWFFGLMTDQKALAAHGQTAEMQAAMSKIGPLMAGPPEMSTATPIVATGFDV
jgi:quinol monooxygenase YgiN